MLTFDDYNDLRRHISSIQCRRQPHICSIDGHRQSRKSTIAKRLGKDMAISWVSTDTYRRPGTEGRPYIDQLSLQDLAADIAEHAAAGLVLVEGICIGWTLDLIHCAAHTRAYCKRMTQTGLWADDLENFLDAKGAPEPGLSQFDTEVVTYHLKTRPDLSAHVIYCWNGDAPDS